jgi:hypothetical protein
MTGEKVEYILSFIRSITGNVRIGKTDDYMLNDSSCSSVNGECTRFYQDFNESNHTLRVFKKMFERTYHFRKNSGRRGNAIDLTWMRDEMN